MKEITSTILLLLLTALLLGMFIFSAFKLTNLMVVSEQQLEELYNGG